MCVEDLPVEMQLNDVASYFPKDVDLHIICSLV